MIDLHAIEAFVADYLRQTDYELVSLACDAEDNILVEIDRLQGVDVDFCAELNRRLVEVLDQTGADYSLEVGSVSLTAPFKTRTQYLKNLGHDVEVLDAEGKKHRGQLVSVDDDTFSVDVETMVAVEGKKRKQKQIQTLTFPYNEVKYTKYNLKF